MYIRKSFIYPCTVDFPRCFHFVVFFAVFVVAVATPYLRRGVQPAADTDTMCRLKKTRQDRAIYKVSRGLHVEDIGSTATPLTIFAYLCGNCDEQGYNATTCRRPYN